MDGVRIAWTSIGEGPVLVHLPGVPFSNVEAEWGVPALRQAFTALGAQLRLIQFENVFAAGGATIQFAGRDYRISAPRIIEGDEAAVHLPGFVRFASARLGLRQFVLVRSEAA